jgi:hypothetical protein
MPEPWYNRMPRWALALLALAIVRLILALVRLMLD